jgi:N-methylhydantoinase B
VANRAHHADIGGAHAGSMSLSREIFEEGLRIPPVKIFEGGRVVDGVMKMLLANVRTPREREGDLTAQVASCRIGERRLAEIVARNRLRAFLIAHDAKFQLRRLNQQQKPFAQFFHARCAFLPRSLAARYFFFARVIR